MNQQYGKAQILCLSESWVIRVLIADRIFAHDCSVTTVVFAIVAFSSPQPITAKLFAIAIFQIFELVVLG